MQEEQAGQKADKHVTCRRRILRRAKEYGRTKVGNHRSLRMLITSGIPTRFMTLDLVRAQDMGTILKLSVMLLFPLEMFPAECIARIDDTINRSCTKDHQKPHTRAIQAGFIVVADC